VGVILRQSLKTAIVRVVATAIGMVSMLFVYPLDHESYGTLQFIASCAFLILPFTSMGGPNVVIKYFTEYKNKTKDERSLLPTILLLGGVLVTLGCFIFYLSSGVLLEFFASSGEDQQIFSDNLSWILALVLVLFFVQTTNGFISNYGRIVVPGIIVDLGYKIFLPAIILLVYTAVVPKEWIAQSLVSFYLVAFCLLLIYAWSISAFTTRSDFSFFKSKSVRRSVLLYGLLSSLTSIGAMVAFRLDSIMITKFLGAAENGLYFNVLVMASVIDMPSQAIYKIASPVISKNWSSNNLDQISKIYQKSSIVSQVVGSLIFVGIWANLDYLISISSKPEAFINAIWLFVVLGAAKLIDAVTGLNSHIIAYSEHYRFNVIFILVLALVSIATNYYFIPRYGVLGAGMATCISLLLFNLMKLVFLKVKCDMHPFTAMTLVAGLVMLAVAYLTSLIPVLENPIVGILINSIFIVAVAVPSMYFLKVSPDINGLIDQVMSTGMTALRKKP